MKKIITSIIMAGLLVGFTLNAATHKGCGNDWKEKMASEKIAFLTMELDLTPEEAQIFWPVYNQVEKEKDAAFENVIKAYKVLSAAVEEGKSEKETSAALESYLDAQEKLRVIEDGAPEKLMKALPAGKVAKLYVAEEKFRRQHIRKLRGGEGKPDPQANK